VGRVIDLTGRVFFRWTVLHKDPVISGSGAQWICQCKCGTIRSVKSGSLLQCRSKSCGCYGRDVQRKRLRKPAGEQSFNEVYRRYKANAKKKGRVFKLDKESFREITQRHCHYCGCKPSKENRDRYDTGSYIYNGIDRYDNNFGYSLENSVPCCEACNRAKLMMSAEDYINLCKRVAGYHEYTD